MRRTFPVSPILAVLLAGAVAYSFATTINKPDYGDNDFGAYYRAAERVAAGASPYQMDEFGPLGSYPYAPAFAYLLAPLASLDYLWAARLWLLANWAVVGAALLLAGALARDAHGPQAGGAVPLLAALPLVMYFWANLRVGQVGVLLVACCLAAVWCRRRGWPVVGGLLLAVACALKLGPGLLVLWGLWRREWRWLGGCLAGAAVLFLVPAFWVGWGGAVGLHLSWAEFLGLTQIPEQTYRPGNQSLLALLARLPWVGNGHACFSPDNLTLLSRCYPWLVLALGVGLCAWFARNRGQDRQPWAAENVQLAVLLLAMTLLHPRAWRCNFVALVLPCVLLVMRVRGREPGWRVALAVLVLVGVVCAVPTGGVGAEGWSFLAWLAQGKHFLAALAVGGVLCIWAPPGTFRTIFSTRNVNGASFLSDMAQGEALAPALAQGARLGG